MKIEFSNTAQKDLKFFKKITKLLKEIIEHSHTGSGKPEALKHEYSGYWSRRITSEHRLVYRVSRDVVFVHSLKGHYH